MRLLTQQQSVVVDTKKYFHINLGSRCIPRHGKNTAEMSRGSRGPYDMLSLMSNAADRRFIVYPRALCGGRPRRRTGLDMTPAVHAQVSPVAQLLQEAYII